MNIYKKVITKFKDDGVNSLLLALVRRATGYHYVISKKQERRFAEVFAYENTQKKFQHIYRNKLWGDYDTLSGAGSTLEATRNFRDWLISNIPKLQIKSIVDAPCGDLHWMQHVLNKVKVNYIGLDIVPEIIDQNNQQHQSRTAQFFVKDVLSDEIPACDMIIARDFLFHLSFKDINKFLENLQATNYRYLVTTTYSVDSTFQNSDIKTGDFRVINLFGSPFKFEEKHISDRIHEGRENGFTRELIVIPKQYVPKNLQDQTYS